MQRHGMDVAISHKLIRKSPNNFLFKILSDNETILINAYQILSAKNSIEEMSPATEWLLDNFYLIQQQIQTIRKNLPKKYDKTLPQLADMEPCCPRVYDIALQIIAHGDGRWDLENLTLFINAYQEIKPLTLGELWAIPLVLGIALIENLGKASQRIIADRNDRHLANLWADRMIEASLTEPKKLILIIADMARSEISMSNAFIAALTRRLQIAALSLPLSWIEQHLMDEGSSTESIIQDEAKQQVSIQATVSNSIDSLRRLGLVDWRCFVEEVSIVNSLLEQDPVNIYSKMDFNTRDRYRHVIEKLSRTTGLAENLIAEKAIQLAKSADLKNKNAKEKPENLRYSHVGYYLIDQGVVQFEQQLDIRQSIWQKLKNLNRTWVTTCYFGSIGILIGIILYMLLNNAYHNHVQLTWLIVLGFILALGSSQVAKDLIDFIATMIVKPKPLPRMDYKAGIPEIYRTLVVVPAMLTSLENVDSLIEALEIRYLGNREQYLHFMLLTDFCDAPQKEMPNDQALLQKAQGRIAALNQHYHRKDGDIFFLCHRAREWNASENIWMGRERKRGKIGDLNQLLLKNEKSNFVLIAGNTEILNSVKYVITLDTDTQLPRESARHLIEAMSHPLNLPIIDKNKQIVVDGHAILQPRIAESLPSGNLSYYLKIYGNEFGIDPYTRTVSDVYQDLFQEGSFIGKGIYDVEAFQKVLGNRFPNNSILSHDLLEGCYLRSGYISDVALFENSPSNYISDVKRRSRWIRGDWQLLRWLLPKVKNGKNQLQNNPLSFLSKMKLIDNLRRSLVPISYMALLILSWTILFSPIYWFSAILIMVFLPAFIYSILELVRKPNDRPPNLHFIHTFKIFLRHLEKVVIYIACLPYEAWYSLTAILRTCWRILFSKKHLLEWIPSEQENRSINNSFVKCIRLMWLGPVMSLLAITLLIVNGELTYLFISLPVISLWFISPCLMCLLSQPIPKKTPKLTKQQLRFLHKMARKTWDFFDTFVSKEDHWLPPDNFQETPVATLAHRTSPTNIGLSLLANLTAYDFGYINVGQLLQRTQNSLNTVMRLEKYCGHLYNWYDTETLQPLLPRYVSTVDSGNLAGHLLTLRQGLLSLPDEPILSMRYLDGLQDTLEGVMEYTQSQQIHGFQELLLNARNKFNAWPEALQAVQELYDAAGKIVAISLAEVEKCNEVSKWMNLLYVQSQALYDELNLFANVSHLDPNITLRQLCQLSSQDNKVILLACERIKLINTLAEHAFVLSEMDINFLYDNASRLLTIGFNVDEQRRDSGTYDLLSSEARLGIFVAIAQGQLLQESWFALGRLLASSAKEPVLMSWSGSMFEYLMPLLVMPSYPLTLLDQTYRVAVNRHIDYGKERGVPWGMSESGFNIFDSQSNYLYRAFGVPGLGLKRGLEEDLVIAPYASAMALMVEPEAACLNLKRMEMEGFVGHYGFYEAIDYTPSRLTSERKREIVRSFMSHHQGMTLLALSYLLHNQPMQRRFMADPLFQSTLLLLQERMPKPTNYYFQMPRVSTSNNFARQQGASMRAFNTPNTPNPQVQLLSNGRYHVVITQAGGGYSRWKDMMLTRWREDSTRDNWGMFCYIRDLDSGTFWSTQYQPTIQHLENFRAVFTEGHAEASIGNNKLDIRTEIVVSPEDDIELRRIRIHNRAKSKRNFDFTSFFEIVLAQQGTDLSQPSFSNLFVETEILSSEHAILARRRSADDNKTTPWLCHLLNIYTQNSYELSFETDRVRFVGRDRTLASPIAMIEKGNLSNSSGAVLDPIAAIRCQMTLEPDELVIFDLLTGVTETREKTLALVHKYQDRRFANRIFGLAWTHSQVLLHQLNMNETDAQIYGKLASAIIYASQSRRADSQIIVSNCQGQSGLWGYSISGDLPIVLLSIEDIKNIDLVRQLIQAQAYWRMKGLEVDLVILNEENSSYRQSLQDLIVSIIAPYQTSAENHPSKVYVLLSDQVPDEKRILLKSVARVVLSDKRGSLKDQLNRRKVNKHIVPALEIQKLTASYHSDKLNLPKDLHYFNGVGGFANTGDEYVIYLKENMTTPAPWVNILANPNFGTLVSECGQGYTWFENSHEFRLTPWENDPLQDSSGELFYLRDDETGSAWSPTLLPRRGKGEYLIRHGFGYSVFEHIEEGIHTQLWMYVASDAAIKFSKLIIRNNSGRTRQLSAIGFIAWVLGDLPVKNFMHIVTELTSQEAVLARNNYNTDFIGRTAFFNAITSEVGLIKRSATGDRKEFVGRNGSYREPAALKNQFLSNKVGACLDPCAAIQFTFNLADGQSREIVFTLGAGQDQQHAEALIEHYQNPAVSQKVLSAVRQFWQKNLNAVSVKTPDTATNLLANGWLLYQVLSSRLWGRTGYYQSSGAFGFRDQLQDVMSLMHSAPQLTRAHLLLCAAHQFEEGDVQHWWHPPQSRGVRTRCSDDYLWLPFALCQYIQATGDRTVLDEKVPFLHGRPLNPDEESYYELPTVCKETFSVYEHAVRAVQHGLRFGVHGLPLMGSGDWNDGMNLVGIDGRGESIWLGFFLYSVLTQFEALANQHGDVTFATRCKNEAVKLKQNLQDHGWDGEWYLRAYFDDGTPLGSSANSECKIDSIAQSWSVISNAASSDRAKQAMQSLKQHLVNEDDKLIKLLAPPFDKFKPSPGYIEGYVPGIRENGGQYTHGAVWAVMAFALMGDHETAWHLFSLINPINHGSDAQLISRYMIEPYVTAGDVYSVAPHAGHGGWSWYTGSAGWMYRLILEKLLGIQLEDGKYLNLVPQLPKDWNEYSVDYQFGSSTYHLIFGRTSEHDSIKLDGNELSEKRVLLTDDGQDHQIEVMLSG